ncbi:MAG: methionine--tRNA ligase [Candidatus Harrisonbacteria bacterium]|nr:methionine--tRNA ligase [Candidatus Harrisonbacteria bacterium]
MSKKDVFYLTASIPYVNAKPHLGHALEYCQGDVLARWHRNKGIKTFYVSGADENSLKIVRAAEEAQKPAQEFSDEHAKYFLNFLEQYHISIDKFQRSSSEEHKQVAQEFWQQCEKAGAIYKKKYKGLYCVSCELFYQKEELDEEGFCVYHPGKGLEIVEEENYFFKLSQYQEQLIELIESDRYLIRPETRKNEALAFIKRGLEDFSISRSKERARGWGVEVPSDQSQYMYVWFDALNVYRSAAPHYWPPTLHIIGKDILRFHAIYWPAMLLAAGEKLPKELFVHGFLTYEGKKMSKSLGNVIDPIELINEFGVDGIRYFLLREIPSDSDGDFSRERLIQRYNADLANGIGNFASRVLTLASQYETIPFIPDQITKKIQKKIDETRGKAEEALEKRKMHEALASIFELMQFGDRYLNEEKPWEEKSKDKKLESIRNCVWILHEVSLLLDPFIPESMAKIRAALIESEGAIKAEKLTQPLFPRI